MAVSDALANSFYQGKGKVMDTWEKSLKGPQEGPEKYMSDQAFEYFTSKLPVKRKEPNA